MVNLQKEARGTFLPTPEQTRGPRASQPFCSTTRCTSCCIMELNHIPSHSQASLGPPSQSSDILRTLFILPPVTSGLGSCLFKTILPRTVTWPQRQVWLRHHPTPMAHLSSVAVMTQAQHPTASPLKGLHFLLCLRAFSSTKCCAAQTGTTQECRGFNTPRQAQLMNTG